jgi:hypothetical protein
MPSKIGVNQRVPQSGPVILPVGDVFQNCWNRNLLCLIGKPNSTRKPAAITHWNPDVVFLLYALGEVIENLHEKALKIVEKMRGNFRC